MDELFSEYEAWPSQSQPEKKFKMLLGRYYEEYGHLTGESYLSAARVRDRGFDFQKTDNGCTFSITRHLNAFNERKPIQLIVELWEVVLEAAEFKNIGERPWAKGDPE